jgi:multidrug efflux pump subunit AcrB
MPPFASYLACCGPLNILPQVADRPRGRRTSTLASGCEQRELHSDEETPIAWITRGDVAGDQTDPREEVEDVAKTRLDLVEGVGAVWLAGGQEREVGVYLDPARLAARGLTVTRVRDAIQVRSGTRAGGISTRVGGAT